MERKVNLSLEFSVLCECVWVWISVYWLCLSVYVRVRDYVCLFMDAYMYRKAN